MLATSANRQVTGKLKSLNYIKKNRDYNKVYNKLGKLNTRKVQGRYKDMKKEGKLIVDGIEYNVAIVGASVTPHSKFIDLNLSVEKTKENIENLFSSKDAKVIYKD